MRACANLFDLASFFPKKYSPPTSRCEAPKLGTFLKYLPKRCLSRRSKHIISTCLDRSPTRCFVQMGLRCAELLDGMLTKIDSAKPHVYRTLWAKYVRGTAATLSL